MRKLEFVNGVCHIVAACAYGFFSLKSQTIDLYSLLAFAMSGIGACYIGQGVRVKPPKQ